MHEAPSMWRRDRQAPGYLLSLILHLSIQVCASVLARDMVHIWRSEGNFGDSVLSFHHAGPGD